ncbi:MAG TPA: hypothetical protein PLU36_05265 [Chitinophagaceae bacterium]|nr:hypothetical protein [Chitinophagaceae bacterium]HNE93639.1 hypothetical protein [Chitinophagaceae bacterium]HNF30261.1 hypothetical protein [Chitinophagaceae bacterium]HNM33886.1 hypothetical protein [Chitinophagaceae bacterium]
MKYQIGDEIIVLLTQEEGRVIDIISEDMVMIEVKGVRFPAYMNQIDFPYFYRFSKKKSTQETNKVTKIYIDNIPKEKPQPNKFKVEDGVWLSLIPIFTLDEFNDEVVEKLKIYIINKTNVAYKFQYTLKLASHDNFALENEIIAHHDFYIHDLDFANVNDYPNFYIDFSLSKEEKLKAEHFETCIKLKPKQIFKRIEALKETNESNISYKLFEEYPDRYFEENTILLDKLKDKGFRVYEASKVKENLQPARSVIDLHIEKLSDSWKHLSNFEILTLQLNEFEKWYNIAIANKLPSFIVIHGVGKGKLKDEIHEILKSKKEVKNYINQYDARFGYGATEIFFK